MLYFIAIVGGLFLIAVLTLPVFFVVLFLGQAALNGLDFGRSPRFLLIMLKSLRRNLLRTSLTYVAIFVMVFVITMIWSILAFMSQITEDKSKDLKVIITEKDQLPSQMPFAYAEALRREALDLPEGMRPKPEDLMSWQFYGGNLDAEKRTRENLIFFFALEPRTLRTMMDDLEDFDPKLIQALEQKQNACIVGRDRLKAMNKRVGERFKVYSLNYKDIDLEFEIVGEFPPGRRYDQSAVMNCDYLNRALDDYPSKHGGAKHPLAAKTLNLYWIRLPTKQAFELLAARIGEPGKFSQPAVKVETASSGIASWLDAYRDLIWGMRWLLSPAIVVTMALVVANAISISVRERITEMAVLKVLGFRPWQILVLVLGEALLIGGLSGFISSSITYVVIDMIMGGFKFPIAFFPAFFIPMAALWWGPILGGGAAFLGSITPALSARTIKVSEVFAKVA